jgi:hypothetical protein
MRRMLIPLAGLLLVTVVGCHFMQGQCDCDNVPQGVRHVGATSADLAPTQQPLTPVPLNAESLKDMPRRMPDK